jgi:hypothetical protein
MYRLRSGDPLPIAYGHIGQVCESAFTTHRISHLYMNRALTYALPALGANLPLDALHAYQPKLIPWRVGRPCGPLFVCFTFPCSPYNGFAPQLICKITCYSKIRSYSTFDALMPQLTRKLRTLSKTHLDAPYLTMKISRHRNFRSCPTLSLFVCFARTFNFHNAFAPYLTRKLTRYSKTHLYALDLRAQTVRPSSLRYPNWSPTL